VRHQMLRERSACSPIPPIEWRPSVQYCICPLEQPACLAVGLEKWQALTVFQRSFWMADEVECRWYRFLEDSAPYPHPALREDRMDMSKEEKQRSKLRVLRHADTLEIRLESRMGGDWRPLRLKFLLFSKAGGRAAS
jgi:hypothetical protein